MKKVVQFIASKKPMFTVAFVLLSLAGLLAQRWWVVLPALVIVVLLTIYIKAVYPGATSLADKDYWTVPKKVLDSLVISYEPRMESMGYAPWHYEKQSHDCDDYALAGIVVMHSLLDPYRPQGKADPLFLFSFQRDDGPRHRLFFVVTDEGNVYIDSWRVDGKLYRKLSLREESNGRIIG